MQGNAEIEEKQALTQQIESLRKQYEELQQKFEIEKHSLTEELESLRCRLERERKLVDSVTMQASEQVVLDVGGVCYHTSVATLTSVPDSMLAVMFSGRHTLIKAADGSYFIDQEGETFQYVLEYLRTKRVPHLESSHELSKLIAQAQFFGLRDLERKLLLYRRMSLTPIASADFDGGGTPTTPASASTGAAGAAALMMMEDDLEDQPWRDVDTQILQSYRDHRIDVEALKPKIDAITEISKDILEELQYLQGETIITTKMSFTKRHLTVLQESLKDEINQLLEEAKNVDQDTATLKRQQEAFIQNEKTIASCRVMLELLEMDNNIRGSEALQAQQQHLHRIIRELSDQQTQSFTPLESLSRTVAALQARIRLIDHKYNLIQHGIDQPTVGSLIFRRSSATLSRWIYESTGRTQMRFVLLYKATVDGFAAATFHNKCNFKGPTITLIQSTQHVYFGGYTSVAWRSNGESQTDPTAFLFLLNRNVSKFPINDARESKAVTFSPTCGPSFSNDLIISDKANESASSSSTMSSYNAFAPTLQSFHPNMQQHRFRVAEIEVYQVIFS